MSKTQSLLLVLIASACRVGFAATFTSQSLVDRAWCEFADSQIVAAMTITSPTCKKNTIAAAQNDLDAQVAETCTQLEENAKAIIERSRELKKLQEYAKDAIAVARNVSRMKNKVAEQESPQSSTSQRNVTVPVETMTWSTRLKDSCSGNVWRGERERRSRFSSDLSSLSGGIGVLSGGNAAFAGNAIQTHYKTCNVEPRLDPLVQMTAAMEEGVQAPNRRNPAKMDHTVNTQTSSNSSSVTRTGGTKEQTYEPVIRTHTLSVSGIRRSARDDTVSDRESEASKSLHDTSELMGRLHTVREETVTARLQHQLATDAPITYTSGFRIRLRPVPRLGLTPLMASTMSH